MLIPLYRKFRGLERVRKKKREGKKEAKCRGEMKCGICGEKGEVEVVKETRRKRQGTERG